ncbi:hypothetical protein E1301_Tti022241 [Triplophysa tibetana]|uniref:Uncharacterized protein n=1 Tax=Triplophysa tibetana TaxID=1572043 RepID=A0A5A9NLE6_9TELE|nr:hypothetical protein E1301_Tti022241 [Triplophysa tibetana]
MEVKDQLWPMMVHAKPIMDVNTSQTVGLWLLSSPFTHTHMRRLCMSEPRIPSGMETQKQTQSREDILHKKTPYLLSIPPPYRNIPNTDTPSRFLLLSSRDVPSAPQPASTKPHGIKGWMRVEV